MFLARVFTFTYETVREWEDRFAPLPAARLRTKRRGKARLTWHVARFCSAHDERSDHLRSRRHLNETVSLADQRRLFQDRWSAVCAVLQAGGVGESTRAIPRAHARLSPIAFRLQTHPSRRTKRCIFW